jgi:hydroxybutyrate-dimer hydrolase
MSYGLSDASGAPVAFTEEAARALFSDSSGIPTTMIAEDAVNGPIAENLAISSFGTTDLNIDSALCFRYLSTGDPADLGAAPTVRDVWNHKRVARGRHELQTTGNTHGKPAIVIHGREDSQVFPNFQSRAYYALNQEVEGATSNLRYWEVTPAQHFDTFISSFFIDPGTGGAQFVPLHFYLIEGLELMMAHLTSGTPLPPAQVIRAEARGTVSYTPADVGTKLPLPSLTPAASDQITFAGGVLSIPD